MGRVPEKRTCPRKKAHHPQVVGLKSVLEASTVGRHKVITFCEGKDRSWMQTPAQELGC